jgi:hypothetical protein
MRLAVFVDRKSKRPQEDRRCGTWQVPGDFHPSLVHLYGASLANGIENQLKNLGIVSALAVVLDALLRSVFSQAVDGLSRPAAIVKKDQDASIIRVGHGQVEETVAIEISHRE